MANKRMFSKAILQSTKYLKMPHSTQSLYIQLCIDADDEGLVEAFKIMTMLRCSEDDLKILLAKQFIYILNDDLLVFIIDWENHNTIRADRKCVSIYHDELQKYLANSIGCKMTTKWQPNGNQMSDQCQHRLVEYSIEESSIEKAKCQADDIPQIVQEQKLEHASAKASPKVSENQIKNKHIDNIISYWENETHNVVSEATKKQVIPLINKVLKDFDANDCQDVIDYIITSEYHISNGYTGLLHIFRATKFAEKLERAKLKQPILSSGGGMFANPTRDMFVIGKRK